MLLDWYRKEARTLPWRDDPSPYHTWISEMMLQQTRVDTVIPYYNRFVTEVPSVEALSEIPEEKLLKLWQGLGYYNRAMNMKKAARMIVENFNGEIPSSVEELQTLPGIGVYSAGAIASIAFGARACAVDGNVLRVIARITANTGDIADRQIKRELQEVVSHLLPAEHTGDFNQALMDLGATVCLPNGEPKCGACPMRTVCKAFKKGLTAQIPQKDKDKKRQVEKRTVFILSHENRFALRKRDNKGLLANLWEFPNTGGQLSEEECIEKIVEWGLSPGSIRPVGSFRHVFSHLEWHMSGYFVSAGGTENLPGWVWVTKEEMADRYSIPTAFRGFIKWIEREL